MGRRVAFDPLCSYTAARGFTWKGQQIAEGDAFNDRSDMRRFRQLYDTRLLRMIEVDNGAPPFAHMSVEALRKWLSDHGQPNLAHPRSTRDRLIERCRRLWMQENQPDGVTSGHPDPQGSSKGVQEPAAPRGNQTAGRVERERIG